MSVFILRGQVLSFAGDPFVDGIETGKIESDGAVVVENGLIVAAGPAQSVLPRYPGARIEHCGGDLIAPGFVDCHVHYTQMPVVASYGEELLEWLNQFTFPAETKFEDKNFATAGARLYLNECLRNGVTTASVYGSVHAQSVDAFFEAAQELNMRMACGKVLMDRKAPDALCDNARSGYDESKRLIERWHGKGRATYAITPRFAITSTPQQLEAAGALWRECPDALMQTHLSENNAEIVYTRQLYPQDADYFAIYERFGLAGPGAIFGHAIHLTEREKQALRESGSSIAHCPTSNLFLGSGLFDMKRLGEGAAHIPIGLASDVGAGTSLSMFKTMKASYEVCRLQGYALHPAKAWYLATLGSARALRMDRRIGNIAPGYEADLVVIDLNSTAMIEQRVSKSRDIWDTLFAQIIMADDRAIRVSFIAGEARYRRA